MKGPTPISTVSILDRVRSSLTLEVKQAKKLKMLQVELAKKRTHGYINEVRKKDILNSKKKILRDPIEIQRKNLNA